MSNEAKHKFLSKTDILGAIDLKQEIVSVPEWGGSVKMTELSMLEMLELNQLVKDVPEDASELEQIQKMARYLVKVLVDDTGKPIFGEADIDSLLNKNVKVVQRLIRKAVQMNSVNEEKIETAAGN